MINDIVQITIPAAATKSGEFFTVKKNFRIEGIFLSFHTSFERRTKKQPQR